MRMCDECVRSCGQVVDPVREIMSVSDSRESFAMQRTGFAIHRGFITHRDGPTWAILLAVRSLRMRSEESHWSRSLPWLQGVIRESRPTATC